MVRPLKKPLFYVCLPLACRHHVWETHLKHFWEQYSPDKTTTGPNNPLFKALRDNWDQFNSKETSLTRFDWNNSGQWIRAQAQEAKQFFRMIITTGAFRNAEVVKGIGKNYSSMVIKKQVVALTKHFFFN